MGKQLEISAEKATEREEKLKDKIHQLMDRLKHAEARYEYGEMNITKLNHRIDDIEDEIYREKLKIKKVSDELNDTFDVAVVVLSSSSKMLFFSAFLSALFFSSPVLFPLPASSFAFVGSAVVVSSSSK